MFRIAVITAFVHVDVAIPHVHAAAQAIAGLDGVAEVYSVTGKFDLICKVVVSANEDLADVVPGGIDRVDGVVGTETVIAFRAYSSQVLDAGFALGGDEPPRPA